MENALPLFGLGAALGGLAFVIHALGYWWLRVKQLERAQAAPTDSAHLTAAMDARLGRIEAAVDTIAVEIERVGEAHRFVVRLQGEGADPPALGSPPRDAQQGARPQSGASSK